MRINTNVAAMNAYRNMVETDNALSRSMERLSSGLRINRAADDSAGLAISEKMRGQIRGLNQAVRNAQDGISLIQTAEGALNETHSILQRMRELAVQSASDTLIDADRTQLQLEVTALVGEINRIAATTEFNTQPLLTGAFSGSFHIGANAGQNIGVIIGDMDAAALGVETATVPISISTQDAANTAITTIDDAIGTVSTERSELGAVQNRLEHTIANLGVAAENLTAAESRIRDLDVAQEMVNLTRNQIMMQAGTAMLAQANMKPQSVLMLLS